MEQKEVPTGSVREIAGLEEEAEKERINHTDNKPYAWTDSNDDMLVDSFKAGAKWAYDSAARNLPVGNGWTDEDMIRFFAFTNERIETRTISDERCRKWLAEYKLTHSK